MRETITFAMSELPIWMPALVASKASEASVKLMPALLKIFASASRYSGKLTISIDDSSTR
jgi:hypothetical protein